MSRPVKVPEALYSQLCTEAERDGVSVMDALQRQLRAGEASLVSLRLSQDNLRQALGKAQSDLARASQDGSAREATVNRLQAEAKRLRQAVETRERSIAELQEEMAATRDEAAALREDLDDARHVTRAQSRQLQIVLVSFGACLAAWMAWRWWKQHESRAVARPKAVPAPTPPEFVWPAGMGV